MGSWQDYVNAKYSKKQETASAASSANTAAKSAAATRSEALATQLAERQQAAKQANLQQAQTMRQNVTQAAVEAQARADAIRELQGRATAMGQIGSAFGQGIGNFASAIANSPITAAVANTAQRAGSIAAGTLSDALKNTATQKAGAVDRFMADNPDGLMANTRPELQNNFLTAYLDRMNYTGPRTRGDMLDIGERSAAMDERLDMLLNDMSHPEEWQQYIEDNGINWALGEDRRMDEELALKQMQADMIAAENNNKATREKWAALRNTDATSEEALQAMEEAGGEYAAAASAYRRVRGGQADQTGIGQTLRIVDGKIVLDSDIQGPTLGAENTSDAENNLRALFNQLRQESLNAADDDYRAKEAAFYDAQEALRAGWGEDYEQGALSDYEKLTKAEDDAYEALRAAREEDYRTGYEAAQAETGEAGTWMRLYYATLPGRSDFEEKSEGPYHRQTAVEIANGFDDGSGNYEESQRINAMTDRELQTANYLYNTDGPDAAREYMDSMERELNRRNMEEVERTSYEWGQQNPILASIASVPANMINSIVGGGYVIGQAGKALGSNIASSWLGLPVERQSLSFDENAPALQAGVARSAMREGVTSGFGDGTLGRFGKFVYDTLMSAGADSVTNMLTFGPVGEITMGMGAMADTVRETKKNGGSDAQALALGSIAGAAEVITEHLGYERIENLFGASREKIVPQLLTSMASEFGEEATSELTNILADVFIMGDASDYAEKVQGYIERGFSETDAARWAIRDMAEQIGLAGAGGALGGLFTGGGSAALGQTFSAVAEAEAKRDINRMSDVYGKAASVFKNNWDGQMMPGLYKAAFDALYDSGADGTSLEAVREAAPGILSQMDEAKQATIWQAGRNAAEAEARVLAGEATEITENGTVNTQNETERGTNGTESGINGTEAQAYEQTTAQQQAEARWQQQNEAQRQAARYDAQTVTPGVVRQFTAQKLTHDQRSQIRILDELGKHYGVEFDIVDSIAGGGINGSYANGKRITVALDAANQAYVQAGAHEMVHYIKGMDADAYAVLESIVTDALNETEGYDLQGEIQARMAEYARAGQKLTEAEALEEIVAEAVPTVFTDRQAVRELVNQNRTLAQKIRDFITDFVDTLREIAFNYFDRNNRAEIAALLGETERLTEIAKTFDAALDVAGEAADRNAGAQTQQAEEMAASVKGEKNSLKGKTYSYDELTAKPDMKMAKIDTSKMMNRADAVQAGIDNVKKYADMEDENGAPMMMVDDLGKYVTVGNQALRHGMDRRAREQGPIIAHIGDILKNSIVVNEADPKKGGVRNTWVLLGAAKTETGRLAIVRSVVNQSTSQLEDVSSLYAVYGKEKGASRSKSAQAWQYAGALPTGSTISIAELLKNVNGLFDDVISQDVANKLGITRRISELTPRLKFSLNAPVERVGELVAVHNIKEEELQGTLELGGFPSPSVAIVKADMGHSMYGENSVVFYASAIDPKADRRNKVYGQDAWTPSFPLVSWQINEKAANRAYEKLSELGNKIDNEFSSRLYMAKDAFTGNQTDVSLEESIKKAMDNYGMKAAYLEDIGKHVEIKKKTEEIKTGFSEARAAAYEKLLNGIEETPEELLTVPFTEIVGKYGTLLDSAFPGSTNSRMRLSKIIGNLVLYQRGKENGFKSEYRTVNDMDATHQAMDEEIDNDAFEKWVRDLYAGVYGRKGIRNSKELFTSSGNRRSFNQLYDEYNLENIVKAMNASGGKNADGWSFHGATGLIAAASQEFKSLKEMRDRQEQLEQLPADEYSARLQAMDNKILELIKRIQDETGTTYGIDGVGEVLQGAASGRHTIDAIKSEFRKDKMSLTDETAQAILDLYKEARDMPTGYFEAKPQRAVGLDEIAAVIVPDDTGLDVDAMRGRGLNVMTYAHGDEQARLAALNSIDQPGVRFSLANTSENSVDTERVLGGINGRPAIKVSGVNETAAEARKRFEARKATQTKEQADKAAMRGQTEAMKLAREVLREYESQYSKTAMRDNMIALMGEIAKNGVSDDTLREATQLARAIIEQSKHVDTTLRDQYKDLRKTLRETPITLTETQRQEAANIAGDLNAFRKSVFGTFNIAREGKSLDAIWSEWSDMAPDLFPPETSEGDMLQQLISVRAAFMPQVSNPYGMDMDGASTELGLRMQERLLKAIGDDAGAREMEAAVNELRRQYADALNEERLRMKREQRAAFDRIAEQLKAARGAQDREAARRAMTDYRAQMKRIGAEQAEAQARLAYRLHYEDRTARAKAYERIRKYAEGLRRMLAKPDKNKHVPAAIQGDLLAVLDAIDFTRDGRETEGTRAWKQSLRTIGDYLARQLDIQTSNAEEAGHEGIWMSLCEPELEQLRESMQVIMRAGKSLSSMTMEELSAFSNAMSIIQHSVNSINQLWTNERHETMDALGDATMRELGAIRDNRAQNSSMAALRAIDNMLNVENLDAGSFFERLGGENGAAYSIFEELRKGQSAAYARVREASEAAPEILGFTDDNKAARTKTIRNWAKETHIFELPVIRNNEAKLEKVTMTGTQLMELYALSRRPQARMHLLSGGMRIAGRDGKTGDSRIWKMDEGQLNSMLNALSDDQKKTVERMQDYLSTTVSEWGNDVTERMYLYRMFGEDNYWPIKSEKGFMRTKEQNGSVLFNALTNAGFTKQTQDVVRNPIMIGDAIETFSGHISDMATFSGLAMPVDDLLRWYNYADRDENGRVSFTDSVKKEIERTTGKGGLSFIQNLLDDLNGMGKKAPVSGIVDWAMGNYKRAAIMAKLRVVIQQPTAILRASAMINPKYLASALTTVGGHNIEEMQQHSALAWWKGNGNYEIGTGESMKSIITGMQDSVKDDIFEKLNSPAGKADDLGWRAIWLAVKRETAAEHKDLEVGSEEYWQRVTERFEDICMKTQVVDTVLTRSGMMRSKDSLMKMATAFMSEPTKNLNLMRTGLSELYGAIQSKNKAAQRRAAAKVLRSGAAITAATAMNAVMTALFDALKYYNPDDDKDEWGESAGFWSAAGMNWVNDMLDGVNPLANIPFVKDIWEIATGGDVERMDMSAASRLYSAVTRAWKYAQGNPNSYTTWAALKPMITSAGDVMGLPVSGLVADVEFAINAARNIMGKGAMSQKLASATSAGAYAALYDAVSSGDARKANQLRAELRKKGKTNEQISQGLADQLALEDDRVRQAWEARQAGQARVTANLKKEIMADGFTEGEAVRAINRYDDVIRTDAKAMWLKAKEQGREDKAAEYEQKLRSVGVTDEDMAKWTAEKDMDAELEEKRLFEKANLYEAIRGRDTTDADILDIRDYLAEHSEAKDPMSGIRSSLTTEFKQEYIDLVNTGKAQEAERLKARLVTAGVKGKTIDDWAPKAAKDELADAVKKAVERGDAETAAAEIERMIDEEIMTMEAMKTRLNNYYKPRYIELMSAGREAEAEALAETLSGLGLHNTKGENYYRGSVFNQWMNDWEKQQEEDE